ncbi:hypothetical protein [Streptomyces sp. NPDC056361]
MLTSQNSDICASGTYQTTLTVTEAKGATGSASATVTCTKL